MLCARACLKRAWCQLPPVFQCFEVHFLFQVHPLPQNQCHAFWECCQIWVCDWHGWLECRNLLGCSVFYLSCHSHSSRPCLSQVTYLRFKAPANKSTFPFNAVEHNLLNSSVASEIVFGHPCWMHPIEWWRMFNGTKQSLLANTYSYSKAVCKNVGTIWIHFTKALWYE